VLFFLLSIIFLHCASYSLYPAVRELCTGYVDDSEVLVELFELIGRLSVRDEFCQKVLELGGVASILSALQNNIADKVYIHNFVLQFHLIFFQ